MKPWTEEEALRLVGMKRLGYSFAQIAERLCRSRNACSAKMARLEGRGTSGENKPKHNRERKVAIPNRWTEEALTLPWKERHK